MNTQKVALITGAARRIGAEIARVLHAAEFNVVLHCRHSQEEAKLLAATFNEKRAQSSVVVTADLRDSSQLVDLIKQAVAAWGRLDVLVNNASCFIKTPVEAIDEPLWNEILDTNLKAPYFLAQLAAPHLAQHQGAIVNITDVHTETAFRDYGIYCVSKAGLVSATKVLAKELGPKVRVNAISPGMMMWPEHENELSPEVRQKIINEAALKCIGSPIDIAKAVLFFVRDADYITGQVLTVDGGRLL